MLWLRGQAVESVHADSKRVWHMVKLVLAVLQHTPCPALSSAVQHKCAHPAAACHSALAPAVQSRHAAQQVVVPTRLYSLQGGSCVLAASCDCLLLPLLLVASTASADLLLLLVRRTSLVLAS